MGPSEIERDLRRDGETEREPRRDGSVGDRERAASRWVRRRPRQSCVEMGALVTAGVLTSGLISFRRGNSQLGQVLMRARVVVQGATVALMVGTAYYYGDNPWI
ncbi:hypothetical protein N665_0601s0014 [Sinapis alba]|nr:hypothetical protein N665_0601s0014 [Sinapis alba]